MPYSTATQVELNLNSYRFLLARRLTTAQVRQLVKQLADQDLTAQTILQQARSKAFEVAIPCGVLVIAPDVAVKRDRLWRWIVEFIPSGLQNPL